MLQVLLSRGVAEEALDADVQEHLAEAAHQEHTDEGVSSVLLLAAQAELRKVRACCQTKQVYAFGSCNSLHTYTNRQAWVYVQRLARQLL